MDSIIRLLDEADDFMFAAALRLQRVLSPKPRERRKVPRRPGLSATPVPAPGPARTVEA